MSNQGFGCLGIFLLPFLPLIWWMDKQSDREVLAEIAARQEWVREQGPRNSTERRFIAYTPEEILFGEEWPEEKQKALLRARMAE